MRKIKTYCFVSYIKHLFSNTFSIRSYEVYTAAHSLFCVFLALKSSVNSSGLQYSYEGWSRRPSLSWTTRWRYLKWNPAMKEATITYSKSHWNLFCPNLKSCCMRKKWSHPTVIWIMCFWNVFTFDDELEWKCDQCKNRCSLLRLHSHKSKETPIFLTLLPKFWLMLTSRNFTEFSCL